MQDGYLGELPAEVKFLIDRALQEGLISERPTQLIINSICYSFNKNNKLDYEVDPKVQGISKHIDNPAFGDVIFCIRYEVALEFLNISLLSDCVMTFRKLKEAGILHLTLTNLQFQYYFKKTLQL